MRLCGKSVSTCLSAIMRLRGKSFSTCLWETWSRAPACPDQHCISSTQNGASTASTHPPVSPPFIHPSKEVFIEHLLWVMTNDDTAFWKSDGGLVVCTIKCLFSIWICDCLLIYTFSLISHTIHSFTFFKVLWKIGIDIHTRLYIN